MTWLEAHLKILSELPKERIRTHYQKEREESLCVDGKILDKTRADRRKQPIIFDGVIYESWEDAVRGTGLTKAAIRWKLFHR